MIQSSHEVRVTVTSSASCRRRRQPFPPAVSVMNVSVMNVSVGCPAPPPLVPGGSTAEVVLLTHLGRPAACSQLPLPGTCAQEVPPRAGPGVTGEVATQSHRCQCGQSHRAPVSVLAAGTGSGSMTGRPPGAGGGMGGRMLSVGDRMGAGAELPASQGLVHISPVCPPT